MAIKQSRKGHTVRVRDQILRFSYWPINQDTPGFDPQDSIFVTNPWTLIGEAIRKRCPKIAQAEAQSSLQQAEFFFKAGVGAELIAAKPLLLYYSLMNLGKAFALTEGTRPTFDKARHGISLIGNSLCGGLTGYQLEAYQSPNKNGESNLFEDFISSYSGNRLSQVKMTYDATALLPQILPGHRVWSNSSHQQERFVAIEKILVLESFPPGKKIWMKLEIFKDNVTPLQITSSSLLNDAGLSSDFYEVSNLVGTPRTRLNFEQNQTIQYKSSPSQEIPSLVEGLRPHLWAIVQSIPPYRKYYLYLCPNAEKHQILPQLAAPYALFFLLGNVTRYRPQEFDALLHGPDGPFIQEFLGSAPRQFLYLLASDFAMRDITLPAIV